MHLSIPANRVLQPLFLRKAQHLFDLRTHVGFANAIVQRSHEHNSGELLDQSAVFRLHVRERGLSRRPRLLVGNAHGAEIGDSALEKHAGQFLKNSFCLGVAGAWLVHAGKSLHLRTHLADRISEGEAILHRYQMRTS